ncbi:DUF5011 domain-containing protein [Microbacterium marinilacus]|uniref:CBM6 domain-containing protein n=1 Tax=Microbacterium marinilacus TaxID=415209 RepID=A0ABP7BI84_9MICO|nr:immunoglobulin-like domain-containing protein [Microbacterium marinilacus]MBY0690127.1 DUF5011 domain-containing protein [Microbacterium marinilacus]
MLTNEASPAPAGASREHRMGRLGIAGLVLLSLTAGSVSATALPAAAGVEPTAAAATGIAVEPVRIQAEDYTSDSGNGLKKETGVDATGVSLGNVGGTYDGGVLTFDEVDLGATPLSTLTVRYVNNSGRVGANPSLDFYLDEQTDENKVATVALPVTGSDWNAYDTTTVDLPEAVSGEHKLIVVMHVTPDAGHPYVGNFDYFEFGPEPLPETFLTTADAWRYSDDGTDPSGDGSLSWTTAGFDDSAWKQAVGSFGSKKGAADLGGGFVANTLLQYTLDGSSNTVPTYHFRNDIEITDVQLAQIESLEGTIVYDDAVRIYVNGEKVAGFVDDRVDEAENQNLAYAGASNGNPQTSTFTIPAEALEAGENTISVALYQDRETSSDIYLDLKSLVPVVPVPEPTEATISDIVLHVGGTEAERNLTWYSDVDVPQAAQLAKSAEVSDGQFPASARTIEPTKTGGTTSGEFFRDATFDGLEENTEYAYRVGSDEKGWSDAYTFRTQDFSGDFSFLFFGDPQVGASGNLARDEAGWIDTVDVATQSYPDAELLFSAGDQVENAPNEAQYDTFLKPDQLRSIPLVATNGNHDVASKAYEQHFNVPNEDLTAGAGSGSSSGGDYWFLYKDVLFIDINSNSRDFDSHNAFMEKVVAEQGHKAKWKVLAFHHSIYSVASHTADTDILERRDQMPAKISELGFDLVLMGHDHNYTRSYLIKDGELADSTEVAGQARVEAEEGEVLYITANSSSGSKYYDTRAPEAWFASVINQEKVRNYSAIEVTDREVTVRTLRSQQSVVDGKTNVVNSVVDEVVLAKPDHVAPELTVPADGEIAFGADFDPLEGVSATDDVDGDLTDAIEVSGAVDTSRPGSHGLTYTVSDAAGNTATKDRAVTVTEKPEEPGIEEPGTDEPGTEEPGTDEPGTDEPGTEEPGTDEPGTDEPGTDEPGTDQPGTDEPGTDEPGTDEPGTEESGTDQPGTDESGTDQPGTDESGTDQPGTDQPGTDEPGTDQPDAEEPSADEPAATQPSFTPAPPVADGADLPAALRDRVSATVSGRTVSLGGLTPGEWHYVYAYSEPTGLGWVQADGEGLASTALPAGLEPGVHRIAVLDADGDLIGWTEVTVGAGGLAATGSDGAAVWGAGALAVLLLVAGGALLVARRRGRVTH